MSGRAQPRATFEPRHKVIALSVVAPAFNEAKSLRPLVRAIGQSLVNTVSAEVILVDDGSTDGSWEVMEALTAEQDWVRAVRMDRNSGQSAAIWAGALASRGELIATIDADLQQDPADLLPMLQRMGDYDAVVGYRTKRYDAWHRRLSSRVANGIRSGLTGDGIRDAGCSLKVFRRDALLELPPFDGMHRFLPTLLRQRGSSVVEHPVSHSPRVHGSSHYTFRNRAFRSVVDLLAVRWLGSRRVHGAAEYLGGEAGGKKGHDHSRHTLAATKPDPSPRSAPRGAAEEKRLLRDRSSSPPAIQ